MSTRDPLSLAAELRARAAQARPEDRQDLLFLAEEFERLAREDLGRDQDSAIEVRLPE